MTENDASDARQSVEKQFLSVDFVTALSFMECVDRLRCCDDALNQVTSMAGDGSFSLRRTISESGTDVKFWGTLEPRDRGTWVWGTIFENRDEGLRFQPWMPAFVVIVMLFLALDAMIRGALVEVVVWLAVLAGLGLLGIWRWRRRYRHGLRLVEWVYEVLYVPPPHEAAPQAAAPDANPVAAPDDEHHAPPR